MGGTSLDGLIVPEKIREEIRYGCSNSYCPDLHCCDCIHFPLVAKAWTLGTEDYITLEKELDEYIQESID